MCSASFDFWLAKYLGAARIEALSSDFLERLVNLIRRNGFLTSFAVRLVPTGAMHFLQPEQHWALFPKF